MSIRFDNANPILLLPGWLNSGPGHWQSIWETKFRDTRVHQDNWKNPVKEEWVSRLNEIIHAQTSPPILVAHSLGCHLIAAWASSFHSNQSGLIKGALLVAPPDLKSPSAPPEILSFLPIVQQRLPFPSIVLASSNDPFGEIEAVRKIAQDWGAEFECLGDLGHLNAESGLEDWPHGRSFLRNF